MLISLSKKAVMTTENISLMSVVDMRDCLTLQHYEYVCSHPRNSLGKPYGNTNGAIITASLVVDNFHKVNTFYSRLQDHQSFSFSFVFNPIFNQDKTLDRYDQAMIVEGYVVDVLEDFNTETKTGTNQDKSLMVTVQILISKITYESGSNSVVQIISK